jgi:hypothetical protein
MKVNRAVYVMSTAVRALFRKRFIPVSRKSVISSLWRNRLARSAVNRKVGGSSPPRDVSFANYNTSSLKKCFLITSISIAIFK